MTREIAARMVRNGPVAQSPEELDSWIANTPDVRETLERDGYKTHFGADDLFPLLQVFVVQAGGQVGPQEEEAPRSRSSWWLAGFLLLVFVVLVYALIVFRQAP
jgi:hypothetical protein